MAQSRGLSVCLRIFVGWATVLAFCSQAWTAHEFRRGDVNIDGRVDIGDPLHLLIHEFLGAGELLCLEAADADDDGAVSGLTDSLRIFQALISGTETLPAPGGRVCGRDSTGPALGCGMYDHDQCSQPSAAPEARGFEVTVHAAAEFQGTVGERFPVSVSICHDTLLGASSVALQVTGCHVVTATASPAIPGAELTFSGDRVFFGFTTLMELPENSDPGRCPMPTELFSFEVEATAGRGTCHFVFVDELSGPGLPVSNRVASTTLGGSFRPVTTDLAVPYCITSSAPVCPPLLGLEVESSLVTQDGKLFAPAGSSIELDVFVTIDNVAPVLVELWTLAVGGVGGDVHFVDAVCQLPCLETLIGSGVDLVFSRDEGIDPTANGGQVSGIVASGILNAATPLDVGQFRIGHFRVRVTAPDSGAGPLDVVLFFKDNLEGSSGGLTDNTVTLTSGETLGLADGVGGTVESLTVVGVQDLSLGVITDAFVDSTIPEKYLRLPSPSAGVPLMLTLKDAESLNRQAVFLRWGAPPTSLVYDQMEFADGPNQVMVIPEARGEDAYFLIERREYDGTANSLTVIVEEIALELTSMRSNNAAAISDPTTVSVRVEGVGFNPGTVFFLDTLSSPVPIFARDVVLVSSRRADMVFDLDPASMPALYDLRADDPVLGSAVLQGAFESLPAMVPSSTTEIDVRGSRAYRFNWVTTMTIVVRNLGDIERPAPLIRVRGIVDPVEPCDTPGPDCLPNTLTDIFTKMKLSGETAFHVDQDLYLLGVDRGGFAGRLAPGAEVEIPVTYQTTHCRTCVGRFEVDLFTPRPFDYIGWDVLTPIPGMEAVWDEVWPRLSATFGGSWLEFNESLADLAARLSYRDFPIESVHELVRFAAREALDRPSVAIVGVVKDGVTRAPVGGVDVHALVDGEVHSSSVTATDGTFTLDWLSDGESYTMEVADHTIVAPSSDVVVVMPDASRVLGVELLVQAAAPSGTVANCKACDESDLPDGPIAFPDDLFTRQQNFDINIISSYDPNDKEGPEGDDDDLSGSVNYTINFQNDPMLASGPVRTVRVVELLDGNLFDLDSFLPGTVRVGSHELPSLLGTVFSSTFDPGADSYSVDVTDTIVIRDVGTCSDLAQCGSSCSFDCDGSEVRMEEVKVTFSWYRNTAPVTDPGPCHLGLATDMDGLAVWEFTTTTVDEAGAPIPTGGFLEVDDCCSQGTGSVEFSVGLTEAALGTIAAGEPVENDACIFFDPEAATTPEQVFNFGCSTFHDITKTPSGEFPPPPENLSPADLSINLPIPVTLQWDGDASSYDVYWWTGAEGDKPGSPSESTDNTFVVVSVLNPNENYFWQVVALDEEFDETEGEIWEFHTLPTGIPPLLPTNPMPPDGASDLPPTLDFSWEAPGATSYDVLICTDCESSESLAPAVMVQTYTANGIFSNLLSGVVIDAGREYTWRVVAKNEFGEVTGPEWTLNTAEQEFRRGDFDETGVLDLSDAVNTLLFLFLGESPPPCMKAGDVDDSGAVDISDPINFLMFFIFGSFEIPAPFEDGCGLDETPDSLTCASFDPGDCP